MSRTSKNFQRGIGIIVLSVGGASAALLAVAILVTKPSVQLPRAHRLWGLLTIFYSTDAPTLVMIVMAVVTSLAAALGTAVLERRVTNQARRSSESDRTPLAPRIIMADTYGEYAGPVTITVLIPAHNEESCLGATLASLGSQSHSPARIVVVADNCTDATADIARRAGAEVFETRGNTMKKAGALNQALAEVLPGQGDNDLVMVMDADTTLDDGFLEGAVRRMTHDRALMAIGGLFYGEEGSGVLGQFQRNEYIRYQREIRRRRGRVFVLTGTASIFRPRALRTVAAMRGGLLPGRPGDVYDTLALTEDNELTIALKSLGGLMISPAECTVVTEVMPTWRTLRAQRLRWQRGALENLGAYGVTWRTSRYWLQQLGIGYGVIALCTYLTLILLTVLAANEWVWFPFWLGIGFVFAVERVVTVWRGGWRARLVALALFPELYYALVLNVIFVRGIVEITQGRQATWNSAEDDALEDPLSSTDLARTAGGSH